MDLEVTPQPSPGELEALREAVRRQLPAGEPPANAWWREGVRENVLAEEEDGPRDP